LKLLKLSDFKVTSLRNGPRHFTEKNTEVLY
jgi:hypothetical protein